MPSTASEVLLPSALARSVCVPRDIHDSFGGEHRLYSNRRHKGYIPLRETEEVGAFTLTKGTLLRHLNRYAADHDNILYWNLCWF